MPFAKKNMNCPLYLGSDDGSASFMKNLLTEKLSELSDPDEISLCTELLSDLESTVKTNFGSEAWESL